MPIGKNSLKRVTNNGYSNVTTSAPDMENSTVDLVEEAAKLTEERLAPKTPEGKEAAKKAASKKAPCKKASATDKKEEKKSAAKKKAAPKGAAKPAEAKEQKAKAKATEAEPITKAEAANKEESSYVNLGRNLPYFLL